ncbi:CAP domain-containing protein [Anaeromicropila herbilytica]|uniref:SCP domain-containing protein n=1 Tax=Anaeromicropila herbilytica TaxID=2785025 RepID=A0A7R7IDL1_9FIRM|nr:CAP domain-containing protein [Anaeromicropila herbilytica]BCN30128.1 hypothetical protein bsdtb5_14230 [Anaeromicropila herbilytica]
MKNKSRLVIITLLLITLCSVSSLENGVTIASAAMNYSSTAVLVKPTFTTTNRTSKSVTLKIDNVNGATGYRIYRSYAKNKKFVFVGSTMDETFVDKKITATGTYYYKVRAYYSLHARKVYSSFSDVQHVAAYVKVNTTNLNATNQVKSTRNSVGTNSTTNQANQTSPVTKPAFAQQVLDLINAERSKQGLKPLATNNNITGAANVRAKEIVTSFSHTRPNGASPFTALQDYNIKYSTAGENIAYGQPTPQAVVTAWMNSPGHRANIMNGSFGNVGIGTYVKNGTIYWTQLFTN